MADWPRRQTAGPFSWRLFARGFQGTGRLELMSDRLPNAIDRHVASRLRLRRLEAGLTQTDAGRYAPAFRSSSSRNTKAPLLAYPLARCISLR